MRLPLVLQGWAWGREFSRSEQLQTVVRRAHVFACQRGRERRYRRSSRRRGTPSWKSGECPVHKRTEKVELVRHAPNADSHVHGQSTRAPHKPESVCPV